MDLTKLPRGWRNSFCQKAAEDIAENIAENTDIGRPKVRVSLRGPELEYGIQIQGLGQRKSIKERMQAGMVLKRSAELYCSCSKLPMSEAARVGATKSATQASSGLPVHHLQEEQPKAQPEADPHNASTDFADLGPLFGEAASSAQVAREPSQPFAPVPRLPPPSGSSLPQTPSQAPDDYMRSPHGIPSR